MVSSVNSSSKAVYGLLAVSAVAIGVTLFLRSRNNNAAHPIASSLDQKNVSFMAGLPGIGRIWSLLFGGQAIGQGAVSVVSIGSDIARYQSVEDLAQELKRVEARPGSINTLIIYGNNLELIKDPGILALKPMKLILIGVTLSTDRSDTSLDSQMHDEGWYVDPAASDKTLAITVIKVASLQKAVEAELQLLPNTNAPVPTVFIVNG